MSPIDMSDEEIAAGVLFIEGALEDEGVLTSSEEADVPGVVGVGAGDERAVPTCCQFEANFPTVQSDTFINLLEVVQTEGFRK